MNLSSTGRPLPPGRRSARRDGGLPASARPGSRRRASAGERRHDQVGLAERQAKLVAALVAGADPPPGFDTHALSVARDALLRKRSGVVAEVWPRLAAGLGRRWTETFVTWAAGRPTAGALRDGWDLARQLAMAGDLPPVAEPELAARETTWRYDGTADPRRRLLPALRRVGSTRVIGWRGRARLLRYGG